MLARIIRGFRSKQAEGSDWENGSADIPQIEERDKIGRYTPSKGSLTSFISQNLSTDALKTTQKDPRTPPRHSLHPSQDASGSHFTEFATSWDSNFNILTPKGTISSFYSARSSMSPTAERHKTRDLSADLFNAKLQLDTYASKIRKAEELAQELTNARETGSHLRIESRQIQKRVRYAHEDAVECDLRVQRILEIMLSTDMDQELREALKASRKAREDVLALEAELSRFDDEIDLSEYRLMQAEDHYLAEVLEDEPDLDLEPGIIPLLPEPVFSLTAAPTASITDPQSVANTVAGVADWAYDLDLPVGPAVIEIVTDHADGQITLHTAAEDYLQIFKLHAGLTESDRPPNLSTSEVLRRSNTVALSPSNFSLPRRTALRFETDIPQVYPSTSKDLSSHIQRASSFTSDPSHPSNFMASSRSARQRVDGWLLHCMRSNSSDLMFYDAVQDGLYFTFPPKLSRQEDQELCGTIMDSWHTDDTHGTEPVVPRSIKDWNLIDVDLYSRSERGGFNDSETLKAADIMKRRNSPRPPYPSDRHSVRTWTKTHSSPDLKRLSEEDWVFKHTSSNLYW